MASRQPDLRVMVDANVLFAGLIWPRWSYEILRYAVVGDFQMVLVPQVIAEVRRNVGRKFPGFSEPLDQFLQCARYELVNNPSLDEVAANMDLCRHEPDVPIALAAIKSKVLCLVTNDRDLTVADSTTVKLHQQVRVMLPPIFLREMMGWTSEALEMVRYRTWKDLSPPV